MMENAWQHVLVTLAAVGAGVWLVRHRLKRRRSGCSGCPTAEASPKSHLVPLSSLRAKKL